jgi:cysteinyl-tRNA synthetase
MSVLQAAIQERSELVDEGEQKLMSEVKRLIEWLRSDPEITGEQSAALRNVSREWGDQDGRLRNLRRHTQGIADALTKDFSTPDAAQLYIRIATMLERQANSAAIAALIAQARTEIAARCGTDQEPL